MYYAQLVIAQYFTACGIEVIVREGLNNRNDWELRLVIPKAGWSAWADTEYIYEQRGDLYYAINQPTGEVSYFAYSTPGKGFSGSTYNLNMIDGTTKQLIGPWSSRAECMNAAGFPPCKEVNIQGQYNMASNMTMDAINKLLIPLDMEAILIGNHVHIIRL